MKKIVIIGANSFQNPLILKAKEMGYETHVFAWASGDIGERTADYFYPINIRDKETILEKCKEIKPDGITSIGSDLAVLTVNYLAEKLNLPGNDPKFSLMQTNKYEMRKAFKKNNILVPKFLKIKSIDEYDNSLSFPLIVKPTDRSGSRSIALVNNEDELKNAIDNACSVSFENYAIVEEMITGNWEYSCESISYNGEHTILAITKKYTTGFPSCIETGHIEPADLTKEEEKNVYEIIPKALDALKIKNGASHAEFILDNDGQPHIVEIGARMGGDCIGSHLVYISTGYDYLEMVIDVAVGNKPKLIKKIEPSYALIKFIFSKEDLEKVEFINNKYPDLLYDQSELSSFDHEVVDSGSRYGYFIYSIKDKNVLDEMVGVFFGGEKEK